MKIGEGFSGKYADPDPFQAIWNDPAELKKALYVGDGVMVRLDDRPVAYGHVNVIAREQVPLEDLAADRYLGMWAVARITQHWLNEKLQPRRKVALAVWGNQVETAHIHVVPRNAATDATQWSPAELSDQEREAYLAGARADLTFPQEVRDQADAALHDLYKRTRGMALPPDPVIPLATPPGSLHAPGQQMQ